MIEKNGTYPVYFCPDERKGVQSHKALVSLTYAQILEIANVMFYFDNVIASRSKLFGGVRIKEETAALHKSIHNAAVNCCLSLEEADRCEKEGGPRG
jgi:hypothetical protein